MSNSVLVLGGKKKHTNKTGRTECQEIAPICYHSIKSSAADLKTNKQKKIDNGLFEIFTLQFFGAFVGSWLKRNCNCSDQK